MAPLLTFRWDAQNKKKSAQGPVSSDPTRIQCQVGKIVALLIMDGLLANGAGPGGGGICVRACFSVMEDANVLEKDHKGTAAR